MTDKTAGTRPTGTGLARRRFRLLLIYLMLLAPWIGGGAMAALETTANSPLDWVEDDFAPRRDYDRFAEQFGAGDVVVISWPGCVLGDVKLDTFTKVLRSSPTFFDGSSWLFDRVQSGRELLQQWTAAPMSLSPAAAKQRLRGTLLGKDNETTCVVIRFNQAGLHQRGRLVPLIRAAAVRYGGADYRSLHLAGPIVDGYQVDVASQTTMSRFAPLSSVLVFCVCWLCLDSLYAAMLVFGISCVCQAMALAVLHYCGGNMTALLIVLPPLIQVLAIAGGIHLVNYYLDNSQGTPQEALDAALRSGWLPCVLSSTTTAIGLGSLAVSGLAAVREFGVFAAIGVLLTVASLLTLLPGLLRWKPIRRSPSSQLPVSRMWTRLLALLLRYGGLIRGLGMAAMLVLGLGVARLQASVSIETLFGQQSQLIQDYAWIEQHVGPLVPIEVLVKFSRQQAPNVARQLALLDQIEQRLLAEPEIFAVTSCRDFMPATPFPLEGEFGQRYLSAIEGRVRQAGYMHSDEMGQSWRLTAHMSALGDHDYGLLLSHLRTMLDADVRAADNPAPVSIQLSGLMPLVHEIQRQLLRDLFASFLTAFALIGVVMTIVQAGLVPGLISMVPNLFPSLVLFGALGLMNHPIDIGTIMTASVAMGIAVDDTLHFLNFYQRRLDRGATRKRAILAAYRHCGRAMVQTTLICGSGLIVFAFSDFVPTANFAWMMVALLAAALLGDLVLLPALLLHPLGRVFSR